MGHRGTLEVGVWVVWSGVLVVYSVSLLLSVTLLVSCIVYAKLNLLKLLPVLFFCFCFIYILILLLISTFLSYYLSRKALCSIITFS